MLSTSVVRKVGLWLAILAMAFNGLWPLIATAKPGGPEFFGVICSANGIKVQGGAGSGGAPADTAPTVLHCPLCTVPADAVILPEAVDCPAAWSVEPEPPPEISSPAPFSNSLHRLAFPRAPPTASLTA